ncbi:MAG: hypothetical protein QF797_17515 [Alphaproteobacteria bacterium]|jgi:hypothetical protein|nr:hypothetical protein [Alphaproteobacteria bacterium]MDP6624702.1 hypothetical protein [Alphaproteobacteria bacterium]|tara:strand:- start:36 stop:587 length:552 start_codon:yes stop_codon:yes gene_type:complete
MFRRVGLAALLIGFAGMIGGCAVPVVGVFALKDVITVVSLSSTVFTGKGVGEYAADAVTGRDCRIIDAVLRSDRKLCEVPGSLATRQDFRGIGPILARRTEPASSVIMVASRDVRGQGAAAGGNAKMVLVSLVDYPDPDSAGFDPLWKKPDVGLSGMALVSSRQAILVKLRPPQDLMSVGYGN